MLLDVGHRHSWDFLITGSLLVFRTLFFDERVGADFWIPSQCFCVFFCLCLAGYVIFLLAASFLEILKKNRQHPSFDIFCSSWRTANGPQLIMINVPGVTNLTVMSANCQLLSAWNLTVWPTCCKDLILLCFAFITILGLSGEPGRCWQ